MQTGRDVGSIGLWLTDRLLPLPMDGKRQGEAFSYRGIRMFDQLQIRCPRLGGEVTFGYCLRESGDIPCPRVVLCWQPYFPVEAHLRERLTPEQWDRCVHREPKEKMVSIVELIEEAKGRLKEA